MKNFLAVILYCTVFLNFISCGKSAEPASEGNYISTIKTKNSCPGCITGEGVLNFNYYANRKLASIISSDTNGIYYSTVFNYNAQSQLSSANESNSVAGDIATYTFVYDAQGRIVKRTGTPILANLVINDVTFMYDANNKVVGDSTHNLQTAVVANYRVFGFDNNGNIGRMTYYDLFNGTPQQSSVENLTYNSKINPYYVLKDVYFFYGDDPLSLSRNMLINPSTNTSYTYFNNGLPRQMVYKDPASESESVSNYVYMP